MMDYWLECISEAFDDAQISATKEQIETVASWVDGAHENYGMAHGHDCIPNPENSEIAELKKIIKNMKDEHSHLISASDERAGEIAESWRRRCWNLQEQLKEAEQAN